MNLADSIEALTMVAEEIGIAIVDKLKEAETINAMKEHTKTLIKARIG